MGSSSCESMGLFDSSDTICQTPSLPSSALAAHSSMGVGVPSSGWTSVSVGGWAGGPMNTAAAAMPSCSGHNIGIHCAEHTAAKVAILPVAAPVAPTDQYDRAMARLQQTAAHYAKPCQPESGPLANCRRGPLIDAERQHAFEQVRAMTSDRQQRVAGRTAATMQAINSQAADQEQELLASRAQQEYQHQLQHLSTTMYARHAHLVDTLDRQKPNRHRFPRGPASQLGKERCARLGTLHMKGSGSMQRQRDVIH